MANAGHDRRALQAYLGRKNILHTVRYTELAPGRFKDFCTVMAYKDPEKKSAASRRYREAHRDKIRERKRRWHAEHRERDNKRSRQWHVEHRERDNERKRRWHAEHRERDNERSRRWRAEHRAQELEQKR